MKTFSAKTHFSFLKEITKHAGEILLKHQKKLKKLDIKVKEASGLTSTADLEAEKYLMKELAEKFPEFGILSEENCFFENEQNYDVAKQHDWCWVIDPLDGTTNFLNGMDYFSVCIGLLYKKSPVFGIVYRPSNGDFFWGEYGKGSYYKNLIKNSPKKAMFLEKVNKKLEQSILVTGFATEKGMSIEEEFILFKKLLTSSRAVRRMGSAALDLCYLAQGVFDGYWERGLAPWDVAAAGIIAQESGVKISDFHGQRFNPFLESFIAAREPVFAELKKLIRN